MKELHKERIVHNHEKMNIVKEKLRTMISIVSELEETFPGRSFTLDGHLIGSIGEVMAAYYYGVELYKASTETHDGIVNGREVQIKITQQDNVTISKKPDYLLVLYLTKSGEIYEVYNGCGLEPWETARTIVSGNSRHMRVNKLMELDALVPEDDRISALHPIEKMRKEYKNR